MGCGSVESWHGGVLSAGGIQHEQDMNATLRNQGGCFVRGCVDVNDCKLVYLGCSIN